MDGISEIMLTKHWYTGLEEEWYNMSACMSKPKSRFKHQTHFMGNMEWGCLPFWY